MDVILIKELKKKGRTGDIISVKPGYAANFLFPKGLAVPATKAHINSLDAIKKKETKRLDSLKSSFEVTAKKLNGQRIEIKCKTNKGVLYGSITPKDVIKYLADQFSATVGKNQLDMPDHIKSLGSYTVAISLHPDVSCSIELSIVGDQEVEEPTTYEEATELHPEYIEDEPAEETDEPTTDEVAEETADVAEETSEPTTDEVAEETSDVDEETSDENQTPPSDQ